MDFRARLSCYPEKGVLFKNNSNEYMIEQKEKLKLKPIMKITKVQPPLLIFGYRYWTDFIP